MGSSIFKKHVYYFQVHYVKSRLYKKMVQIYKNTTGLSLLNSAFDVTVQKIMSVTSLPSLDQDETGSKFSKL